MILLDTNVVSEPLRPCPAASVVAWLDAQAIGTLHLSTVTLAELRCGIAALPAGSRRTGLASRLDTEVLTLFADRVLPFDVRAADVSGSLRAEARVAGRALGLADAMIASIAAAHGLVVATRDVEPFLAAGVEVVNPFVDD